MEGVLSPIQRENLVTQLGRRLRKLNDRTLLELERSTRHPESITTFVPRQTTTPGTQRSTPRLLDDPRKQAKETARGPITRREMLTYCTGGALALLAASTGYRWTESQKDFARLLTVFDQMEACDLDRMVCETIEDFGPRIDALEHQARDTCREMGSCDATLLAYQSSLVATQQDLSRLERATDQMRNLYRSLEETGMETPTLLQEVVRLFNLVPVPGVEKFVGALDIMLEIVKSAPEAIDAISSVMIDLEVWFSHEEGQGIDTQLLHPLHNSLFAHIAEIDENASSLQGTWTNLVEHIERSLQERERMRKEVANLKREGK